MSRYNETIEVTAQDLKEGIALDRKIAVAGGEYDRKDMRPAELWDLENDKPYGVLMPVDYELVAQSQGIQNWSKS